MEDDRESFMKLANPLSADRTHLRRHLLPSLLETLQTNLRYLDRIAIFETARVYHPEGGELPREPRRLGVLLSGPVTDPSWGSPEPPGFDFFHLKGIVETLAERMGRGGLSFEPLKKKPYQTGRAATVREGEVVLGTFGELDPSFRPLFDLPQERVVLGEFDMSALAPESAAVAHSDLSRFPVLSQDLALLCPEDVQAARVEEVLRKAAGPLLVKLRLFDLYRGDQIGASQKSLAYTLVFQAPDRTLTEKEISGVRQRIVKRLQKELGVELRS